jgi:hypothetical protein
MARFIVTETDAPELPRGCAAETTADPTRAALGQPSAVLLMKPTGNETAASPASGASGRNDDVLVVTLRQREARYAEELADGRKVTAYGATGLLGLIDEPLYEEPHKKHWWSKRGE